MQPFVSLFCSKIKEQLTLQTNAACRTKAWKEKKNGDLRPTLTSKDKITKAKPPLIYQQFFVYEYKCDLSGTWATQANSFFQFIQTFDDW